MPRTSGRFFLGPRTYLNAAWAAIVADPVDGNVVVDYGFVVNVPNIYDVHIINRAVVEKAVALPPSTYVAGTEIPKAINNPAIEAYLRTPIAVVENIRAVIPGPIGRRPQETGFRSQYPCARHPIVVSFDVVPGPVAGRPDVPLTGTKRLLVNRNSRRTE